MTMVPCAPCAPSSPAEESTLAPTDVEAKLNECIQTQNQQIQELQQQNSNYSTRVTELIEKRDHLWDCIADLKDELKDQKEELQEVIDSRAEHRRAEAALREELGLLRRQLRDRETSVAKAMTEANEKAEQAITKQKELQTTVERLEKRLQERRKQVLDQQVSLSVASTESDRKQALLEKTVVELRRQLQQQNERVLEQQSSLAQATTESIGKTRDAMAKQMLLQENVAQLEMRLQEQSKAFEEERAQLMRQASTRQSDMQAELSSSLDQAMPQLRSLLSAYDRVRGNEKRPAKGKQKQTSTARTFFEKATGSELERRLKEQEKAFDQERAQLLEQASDAAKTQRDIIRQHLMEREGILTCPITLDLFEFPVVAGCCGKTFSSDGLRESISRGPLCPFCRGRLTSTHPNRDMTKLVEIHRKERSVLGMSNPEASALALPAPGSGEYEVLPIASTGRPQSRDRSSSRSSTRQSRHRDRRGERTQTRSEVTRRPSSRQTRASSDVPSSSSAVSTSTSTPNVQQQTQAPTSGLSVWTVGSDGPPTAVPPHMVRSVLASMRFPTPQSRTATRGRRQRSKTRTESSTAATTALRAASNAGPRRRTARVTSAAASSTSSTAPISTPSSGHAIQPRPTSSNAATNASMATSNSSSSAVPTATPTASSSVSRSNPVSRTSVAASLDAFMNAWQRSQPASVASAATRSADSQGSRPKPSATSTSTSTATSTSVPNRTTIRFAASQDDSAITRRRQDSPRLALSQPAPRQPLSTIAKGITTLQDLLGSDFESTSDSG